MKWTSAWRYMSIEFGMPAFILRHQTQRFIFLNNLDGEKIRIRFTNRYGSAPLRLDAVTVGAAASDGTVGGVTAVTLDGQRAVELAPGQEIFSDEIPFPARAGQRLAVSIYAGEPQRAEGPCSMSSFAVAEVRFGDGDCTDGRAFVPTLPEGLSSPFVQDITPETMGLLLGFDAVQVLTGDDVKVVAAFGDSITNMGFIPDPIALRLFAAAPGKVTLVNCGISGNRLLADATFIKAMGMTITAFGPAGTGRFERDVFGLDAPDAVVTLMGINDIMHPIQLEELPAATPAEEIIAGISAIADISHRHGAKFFAATLPPAGNDDYPDWWRAAFEKERLSLNGWIRSNDVCDGFFDYDAALRDDAHPGYMRPEYHIGDGLHPNAEGGRLAAETVDIGALV